jgi:hypothetical protein
MVEILPIPPQANVEAVRRQLARGHTPNVALALPEGWFELDNVARLRLLQRQAQIQHRHLALITRQESTRRLAQSLGIPVFFEVADAQRRRWQMYPELPVVDPRNPAEACPKRPLGDVPKLLRAALARAAIKHASTASAPKKQRAAPFPIGCALLDI